MKMIATCISGILFLTAFGIRSFSANETKVDAKELFEKKCSVCHSLDRPRSKKKALKEWEKTVTRMIASRGAKITDEEAKLVIDYLAKNYGRQ